MEDASGPLGILLVANLSEMRTIYRGLLSMYTAGDRYAFSEAETGQDAVDRFDPKTHACVIASGNLPDLTLETFLGKLRERSAVVPAIVVGAPEARERALAAGAMVYLAEELLAAKTLSRALVDTLARAESERVEQSARSSEPVAEPTRVSVPLEPARAGIAPARRSGPPPLAITVDCAIEGRRARGVADVLSGSGAHVQGLSALPVVGVTLALRLHLVEGSEPLEVAARVIEHTGSDAFSVAFDGLDRRKRELLRVRLAKDRKGPPA